jgi:hypothetical protein
MKTPLSQVVDALRLCNPPAFSQRFALCVKELSGPPLAREDVPVFMRYLMSIPIEP